LSLIDFVMKNQQILMITAILSVLIINLEIMTVNGAPSDDECYDEYGEIVCPWNDSEDGYVKNCEVLKGSDDPDVTDFCNDG
jgi:hypothetical protein